MSPQSPRRANRATHPTPLHSLRLPDSWQDILALDESDAATIGPATDLETLEHLLSLWEQLASTEEYWGNAKYPGPERACRILGSITSRAMRDSLRSSGRMRPVSSTLFRVSDRVFATSRQTVHYSIALSSALSFACLQALRVFTLLGASQGITSHYESYAHESVASLASLSTALNDQDTHWLVRNVLISLHEAWFQLEKDAARPWLLKDLNTPLDASDLPAIAERQPLLVRRYGAKLSWIFEQQLSLMFQSLGCHVSSTRRFERSVDLICVLPTNPPSMIIVEAKSTARQYGLPARDQRALAEYVGAIRRNLITLPPLQLLLIVGPAPAGSISNRVRQTAAELGLPIRYCEARTLARLRTLIPGPLALADFLDRIVRGPEIVPRELPQDLYDAWKAREEAQSALIRAWLPSHQQMRPPDP